MYFETIIYFIIWSLSVIYSVHRFSTSSYNYFRYYNDEYDDFTQGISFLSKKRDKADLEWEAIMFLVKDYFPWLVIYVSVALATKYIKSLKIFKLWHILFTVIYILLKWNYIFLLLLLIQPAVFLNIRYLYQNKSSVWMSSSISLALLNYLKSIVNNPDLIETIKSKDYEIYVLICSLFWMNLKCTSFCLENTENTNALDFLSYCFYPPTVFSGPFILYKDFETCYNSNIEFSLWRCKKLARNLIKSLFWFSFLYICLHFVYLNASAYHPQLIENLDSWSLYGFGYAMGQFFHLKYVIQYGISTSIASFERINVPNLPRCIGRIHLYSDMWKYFDPGLYNFLIKNIYLPMTKFTQNKPIRSFFCFSFVYVWHGLETHIFIWTILNYFGLMCESVLWSKTDKIKKNGQEQNWKRRKDCFISAFLLAMSAISNFYFFAGYNVGNVFFRRLFADMFGNIVLIAALYCCCQVSTEIPTVPASQM
ncbi:unnamed protein product [Psylliodes chrysocephalus]|uniref:Protein-cysteine N-palmitoyltransferase Rasp n=1 Tax=Psylliodes chrysocephalus TaxID=3402493 RepID=A0A9P0CG91_9CUCU|nr:unnamed protein product [Psylliodes chrysocephala]